MLGKDSAQAGDDAIGVQAHAAGQGVGQGVLAEQGAGIAVGAAGAGIGGAVGEQQQDVAAGQAEADVGEVDVGEETEQAAEPANFPDPAVRAADQGRRVARGAQRPATPPGVARKVAYTAVRNRSPPRWSSNARFSCVSTAAGERCWVASARRV